MDYRIVHACPEDCVLYDAENADLNQCPMCHKPRYRDDVKGLKVPIKVNFCAIVYMYFLYFGSDSPSLLCK